MAITTEGFGEPQGGAPIDRDRTAEERTARVRTFDSTSPATGEVVGTFPVDGPEQVAAAVARAREGAEGWAGLGFEGRRRALLAYKALLVRRTDELVALVHRENGKPHADALIEVLLAAEHLDWAARNAAKVLGPRRVRGNLLVANHAASVEYQPLGVVGVIGPWNYPVLTPLGSIIYALAAGNAVVFKPSELTPAVGCFLADTFAEAVPAQPVFQVATGDGSTGHALCLAGVDKVALTGSPATGRRVMAACAERLTPVMLELGGKDAMIVDADADLDAAAEQAVWGGMANAGQTCLAIERVYVVEDVYEPFLDRLVERASRIRPGPGPAADFGPMTLPRQLDLIQRHLDDAFARGPGRWSGARTPSARPMSTRWCWSTCRPMPWSCGRRPSARSCRSSGSVTPTTPSPRPTPTPTASARPCSPAAGPTASPAPCARAWPASTPC
jgi:succinate-semialdehyde dehydrogenase / glutarate-semialdehyde dehydrogenase